MLRKVPANLGFEVDFGVQVQSASPLSSAGRPGAVAWKRHLPCLSAHYASFPPMCGGKHGASGRFESSSAGFAITERWTAKLCDPGSPLPRLKRDRSPAPVRRLSRAFRRRIRCGPKLLYASIDLGFDPAADGQGVTKDLVAWDPQYSVAFLGEDSVALLILSLSCFGGMRLTVDFDNEPECDAAEIGGIGRNRVFPTELLPAASPISKHLPHVLGEAIGGGPLKPREPDRLSGASASAFPSTVPIHRGLPPHPQPLSPARNASTTCIPGGGEGSQDQKVDPCLKRPVYRSSGSGGPVELGVRVFSHMQGSWGSESSRT